MLGSDVEKGQLKQPKREEKGRNRWEIGHIYMAERIKDKLFRESSTLEVNVRRRRLKTGIRNDREKSFLKVAAFSPRHLCK
jgi:hypothetical protein